MEIEKRKIELEKKDNEIMYSKSIKAGKRIYYLDVKKSRNDDLFLAITESKKRVTGQDDDIQVSYEKHKIFLYREDFDKFIEGLEDVIGFIKKEQGEAPQRPERVFENNTVQAEAPKPEEEVKPKSFFDRFKL
ncbi:MAG: hypothetical protein AUK44_05375 [Porphyromonadaceae bacterium CG2_30_38_12]|nr:MAG: hypothetical protein AUK44_05375 [Porphyromonadaceae bacterium CG2_30_38_12]